MIIDEYPKLGAPRGHLHRMPADRNRKPGASHFFWSGGCGATSPPFEEVGPTVVLQAAFDGEQGIGSGLRPVASGPLESPADDLLAGAFHEAGSDRQSKLQAEVVAHSVRVGLVGADAGGDGFGPVAVRL